jgi:hypothetical protein
MKLRIEAPTHLIDVDAPASSASGQLRSMATTAGRPAPADALPALL